MQITGQQERILLEKVFILIFQYTRTPEPHSFSDTFKLHDSPFEHFGLDT